MSAKFVDSILRHLQSSSTYVPLVAIAGYFAHKYAPLEIQDDIVTVCSALILALIGAINEQKGPNPQNAPLPPEGTAPVVTPALPETLAVCVPAFTAPAVPVKSGETPIIAETKP